MRNRITWQSVAAPSFADALTGVRQAGNSLSEGFGDLANIAGDIRDTQKETATQRAITQALGITDPNEFAKAVSSGSMYDPRDMTAEGMEFFQGQRGSLLDDQSTIASTSSQNMLAQQRQYDLNRDRKMDPLLDQQAAEDRAWTLANRERDQKALELSDATKAWQSEAKIQGDEIINGSLSVEEAKEKIVTGGYNADQEKYLLDMVTNTDPAQWAVSELTRDSLLQEPGSYRQMGESLSSRQVAADSAFSQDESMRLYTSSLNRFEGSDNPILDVIKGRFGDKAESPELAETRSSMLNTFERLKSKYDLPPEVIANVMDQTMSGTWLGLGSKMQVNEGEVTKILDRMNTDERRNWLEKGRIAYEREEASRDNYQKRYEDLLNRAALARRNGDTTKEASIQKDMDQLFKEFVEYDAKVPMDAYVADRANGPASGTPSPAPQPSPAEADIAKAAQNSRMLNAPVGYNPDAPLVPFPTQGPSLEEMVRPQRRSRVMDR